MSECAQAKYQCADCPIRRQAANRSRFCPDPSLAQWVVRGLEGLPGPSSRRQPTGGVARP